MFGKRYEWPFPITANRLHTVLSDFFSSPINNTTAAAYALSQAKDASKILTVDKASGCAITLPASTGSGDVYDVMITTTVTSNTTTIKVANASDTLQGVIVMADTTGGNGFQEAAGGTDDTITMNGTTTGGIAGSKVRLRDVKKNVWQVEGLLVGSGTLATTLSATV